MRAWQQEIGARPLSPWAIVAAVLLPPLGVFMLRGLSPAFWLTVALTLIGWVPGILFALLLLLFPRSVPIR
jgi:uncharacterized membrane protein YqaE (UPF0057 family)